MVVITLESCPLSLRGDLTKWLQEVSSGVYVGQVSARVRDGLWERVCRECKNGRAVMVFSARNEQRYDFAVHNTTWEPIDYDGIKLMMRPSPSRAKSHRRACGGFSVASKQHRGRGRRKGGGVFEPSGYVVVDIETTGLNPTADEIIELGAIKVINGEEHSRLNYVIKPKDVIPREVIELTGLSEAEMRQGVDMRYALERFVLFVGYLPLVAHNASFDLAFLQSALFSLGFDEVDNEVIDTLDLARKKNPGLGSYRLESLADHYGIKAESYHRALSDAITTHKLLLKLIEN